MLTRLARRLFLAVALLAAVPAAVSAQDFAADDEYFPVQGWWFITLDHSHDLVLLNEEDDNLVVHVLMFDPAIYPQVPSVFEYSEAELFAMAAGDEEFRRDLEDVTIAVITCAGGDDVVFATSSSAEVEVRGDGGNDYIEVSAPFVHVLGGFGDDRIHVAGQSSTVYAGDGDDDVFVEAGAGNLYGQLGNDLLVGNDQSDALLGGQGADRLYGAGGVDVLYGEAGNDVLYGGSDADYLYGGSDNDLLCGGYEGSIASMSDGVRDVLQGDLGADTFVQPYRMVWVTAATSSLSTTLQLPGSRTPSTTTRPPATKERRDEDSLRDVSEAAGDVVQSVQIN